MILGGKPNGHKDQRGRPQGHQVFGSLGDIRLGPVDQRRVVVEPAHGDQRVLVDQALPGSFEEGLTFVDARRKPFGLHGTAMVYQDDAGLRRQMSYR